MAKIIFFGTHEFGAAMLAALIDSGHMIDTVVTQPDRPVGRKQILTESPVKILAKKNNLSVLQPENLKDSDLKFSADLLVVCQYGLIIPKQILKMGNMGAINVHTSLLPKYRGPSPIQSALINGEKETGVTIMLMDEKMDHGKILSQQKISIDENSTYQELRKIMEPIASKLLVTTINDWLSKKITPIDQNENDATYCKLFTREDGKVDWTNTTEQIYNRFRGLFPWPGIWTVWNDKRLKLTAIKPSKEKIESGKIDFHNKKLLIGTSNASIEILTLQIEGKKETSAKNFMSNFPNIREAKLS